MTAAQDLINAQIAQRHQRRFSLFTTNQALGQ